MNTVPVDVPNQDVGPSETSEARTEHQSQFLLAVRLFEMGRVTTAEAAGMCGMGSVDFVLAAQRANRPRPTVVL